MTRFEIRPHRLLMITISLATFWSQSQLRANTPFEVKDCRVVFNGDGGPGDGRPPGGGSTGGAPGGNSGGGTGGRPPGGGASDVELPAVKLFRNYTTKNQSGAPSEAGFKSTVYFSKAELDAMRDPTTALWSSDFANRHNLEWFFPTGTAEHPHDAALREMVLKGFIQIVKKPSELDKPTVQIFKFKGGAPSDGRTSDRFKYDELLKLKPIVFAKDEKKITSYDIKFPTGTRTSYMIEGGSDLAHIGMARFSLETAHPSTPVLIIGDGSRGNMLKTLKARGFKNVQSVDVMYIDGYAEALDRSEVTKGKAQELRTLMAAHQKELIGADASDLTAHFKSGSQKFIFAKDLFEKMDRATVHGILGEALRLLAPKGNARFSFNEATLTEIIMWVEHNKKALSERGFSLQVVPPRSRDSKGEDGSYILSITKFDQSKGSDLGSPGFGAKLLELHPITDAMVAFFASVPENAGLSRSKLAELVNSGKYTSTFFDKRTFKYSTEQKQRQFEAFLDIYFPNFNLSKSSYDYILVKATFEAFVLAPLESGELNSVLHGLEMFRQIAQITRISKIGIPSTTTALGVIIEFGTLPAANKIDQFQVNTGLDSPYRDFLQRMLRKLRN